MAQATEKKGVLRAFWEGFKEGWNGSSATAKETPPPAPAEEVITAADEWDVDELQNAAVAAEAIAAADERDMCAPAMTTVAAPQEKRGLAAFFEGFCEGFKDGWNNPPACGSGSNKSVYDDEDWNTGAQTGFGGPQYRATYDPISSGDATGLYYDPNKRTPIYYGDYYND